MLRRRIFSDRKNKTVLSHMLFFVGAGNQIYRNLTLRERDRNGIIYELSEQEAGGTRVYFYSDFFIERSS